MAEPRTFKMVSAEPGMFGPHTLVTVVECPRCKSLRVDDVPRCMACIIREEQIAIYTGQLV